VIEARVPLAVLRSQELNAPDVAQVDTPSTANAGLLGYAGRASMGASSSPTGLVGGACGGACDGGGIGVGLWEVDDGPPLYSGLAFNNPRIGQGTIASYLHIPTTCAADADCQVAHSDTVRSCQSQPTTMANGGTVGPFCVQDHLSWVAASVGMQGTYDYSATAPFGAVDSYSNIPVSLVWQSCITSEIGVSNLNNDLDLVLNCGSPLLSCHGSFVSNTIPSETEMVEKPACFQPVSCAIDIRIKNGAALSPCGTSATERIGVAWSFR
jgi:hypothetical protein